jgi:glycosyltransferase involved in cell wall biosynthesis
MNITTFGSKHFLGQLSLIIPSLIELGHTIDSDSNDPELIYSNDLGGYEEAVVLWEKLGRRPKLILNCLDLPFHILEFQEVLDKYRKLLPMADKVTTISKKVQKDINNYLEICSEVIYQPVRHIEYIENCQRGVIDFFINGRVLDPNKRGYLALQLAKETNKSLVCAGSDYLASKYNQIYNYGVVSDLELAYLYNRSKITLAFGKIEGIGMQIPESLICGTPIITLSDNLTNYEFCPPEMICNPDMDSIKKKVMEILTNYDLYSKLALQYGEKYKEQFSPKQIALNIVSVYNEI